MANLNEYLGKKFKDLTGLIDPLVEPNEFGDKVITEVDIISAFPQSVTGLINVAAQRYGLISSDTVAMSVDAS